MKLILIRHAETDWVRDGRYQGSSDVPLNQSGLKQARAIAKAIRSEKPLAIYSSGLTRARQTAKLIAQVSRKRVLVDRRLNEVSFGKWEGKTHADIRVQFPQAVRNWYAARWSSKPPGGESLRSLERRVSYFLNDLLDQFSDHEGSCVVVTHGGPIRMFLIRMLKVPPKIFWVIRIEPGSITTFEVRSQTSQLTLLNSTIHLNGLARSK